MVIGRKYVSRITRCLGEDFNQAPLKHMPKMLTLESVSWDMERPFCEHTALFLAGKTHNGTSWLFDQIYSICGITWLLCCLNFCLLWLSLFLVCIFSLSVLFSLSAFFRFLFALCLSVR
jgi:hypothetical protein